MRYAVLVFSLFLYLPLAACVQENRHVTPTNTKLNRTAQEKHSIRKEYGIRAQEKHGIIIDVKSCSLNQDVAVCSLNDTAQSSKRLIADTPYPFLLQAEDIKTEAIKVQSVNIRRIDVSGVGPIQYIEMTLSNPPMRDITHYQQSTAVPSENVETHSFLRPQLPEQNDTLSVNEYFYARIVAINNQVKLDPGLKFLWQKGAYLHLHPNGSLGHNWSKPDTYAYVPDQTWNIDGRILTISLGPDLSYRFTLSNTAMTAFSDPDGTLKMTLYPQK